MIMSRSLPSFILIYFDQSVFTRLSLSFSPAPLSQITLTLDWQLISTIFFVFPIFPLSPGGKTSRRLYPRARELALFTYSLKTQGMKERQKQESERRTIVRLQGGRASERQSVHHNVPRYTTGKSMAEATRPPARCRPSLAAPTSSSSSSSSSVSSCSSSSSYFYISFSLAIVLCLRVRDGQ